MMIPQKYKTYMPTRHPNIIDMTVTPLRLNDEGVNEFNELYKICTDAELEGKLNRLTFTRSGGISIAQHSLRGPAFGIRATNSMRELIIRDYDGWWSRIQIGSQIGAKHIKKQKTYISGSTAYQVLLKELEADGIYLTDYFITPEEGLKVKETIPSPLIALESAKPMMTYTNAHHVDFNASYWSGITEAHPELLPTIQRIYNMRKVDETCKAILTHSQGYFQGKPLQYRLAHLARDGIVWNNLKVQELAERIRVAGGRILAYNTDGFWYDGPLYHGDGEGVGLGQWKTDHNVERIRFKSEGAYEYTEAGQYKPVVRGETSLDRIKPRENWRWGDIFDATIKLYYWDDDRGYVKIE